MGVSCPIWTVNNKNKDHIYTLLSTNKGGLVAIQPSNFSMDFEAAIIGAVQEVFPYAEIAGCSFHLVINLKKAVGDAGLMQI